ncbi:hypothetical protein ACYJ1Y_11485 [Natrialbaceae archaeon A-gly3]
MPSHIKLYGEKSDQFEQLKADLTEQLGYEPSNPEVIGLLMASSDLDYLLDEAMGSTHTTDRVEDGRYYSSR